MTPAELRARIQVVAKAKCDVLWAQLVRDRARGICEMCGQPGRDAHHAVGRHQTFLRHNLQNGCCLCTACHMRLHNTEAHTFWEWFAKARPEDCAYVIANKHTLGKGIRFDEVYERLEEML